MTRPVQLFAVKEATPKQSSGQFIWHMEQAAWRPGLPRVFVSLYRNGPASLAVTITRLGSGPESPMPQAMTATGGLCSVTFNDTHGSRKKKTEH